MTLVLRSRLASPLALAAALTACRSRDVPPDYIKKVLKPWIQAGTPNN